MTDILAIVIDIVAIVIDIVAIDSLSLSLDVSGVKSGQCVD